MKLLGVLPQSSALKNKLHAGFSPSLFFDPEDGGNIFLQNIG
jgi:hypothetical protein